MTDSPLSPNSPLSPHTQRALRWIVPILIALAVMYAYQNACKGPFVFDDDLAITVNPNVRTLWPPWVSMFPAGNNGTAGRPLIGLSYAINYAIDGLNARGYHAVNIGLHFLAALALWGVLRRSLTRLAHPAAEAIAVATTLIWAVHPLLTDTVTYIMDRTEGAMSLFLLLAVYAFLRSIDSSRARVWRVASIACGLLSVACKEVGAMTGPVIFVFDVLVVTQSWKRTLAERKWYYAGLMSNWVLLFALLATASAEVKLGGNSGMSPWTYILMQSQVILHYFRLSIWPSPLVIDYITWPVPKSLISVWPEMAIIGTLVLATTFFVIRKTPAAMLGAWFFLILAPSSSLIPLATEPAAERRMYLPLVALVLGLLLVLERLSRAVPRRLSIAAVAVIVLVLIEGQGTIARNEDFSSVLYLWSDTVAKSPNDALAHAALGKELQNLGDYADALKQFEISIQLSPTFTQARVGHARTLSFMGYHDFAIAELKSILAADPNDPRANIELGASLSRAGKVAEARQVWQGILSRDPGNGEARRLLAETP